MKYEDIALGSEYAFDRQITEADIHAYAKLTGDFNPVHVDKTIDLPFGNNIAHGLLVGSLFSTLVGMYCPGHRALYLSQTFRFRLPVFAGDTIKAQCTVIQKIDSIQAIKLKTEILRGESLITDGEALVKLL